MRGGMGDAANLSICGPLLILSHAAKHSGQKKDCCLCCQNSVCYSQSTVSTISLKRQLADDTTGTNIFGWGTFGGEISGRANVGTTKI